VISPHPVTRRDAVLVALNIAKTIASALSKAGKPLGVKSCTLLKSSPGTRAPGATASGTNPTVTSYAAVGMVTAYATEILPDSTIAVKKRSVLLLGATIVGGAMPAPGDRIVIGGETLTIDPGGAKADPVQATWQCETTL